MSPPSNRGSQTKVYCTAPTDLYWAAFVASSFSPETTINLISKNFSDGETVNLTCKDGLYVSGNLSQQHQIIKCGKNGTWSKLITACSGPPFQKEAAQTRRRSESTSSSFIVVVSILGGTTVICLVITVLFLVLPCKKMPAENI
eukprot:scpid104272/ scgid34010/ 